MSEPFVITSASNAEVKAVRALQSKKGRAEQQAFLSEGLRHVLEAVRQGWAVRRLFLAKGTRRGELLDQAIAACEASGGRVVTVSDELMTRIAKRGNAQSVLAVIEQRWARLADVQAEETALWIGLDRVRDPGNLGSVLRSADAFAASGIILIGDCVDPFSVESVRASMGAIVSVPLIRCSEEAFLDWRQSWSGDVVGTHLSGELPPPDGASLPTLLLMGNEQAGLSDALTSACESRVRIPMRDGADSLNLAAASAILLHALTRGRF